MSFEFILDIKSFNFSENSSSQQNKLVSNDFLKTIYSEPPVKGGLPTFIKYNIPLKE